MRRMGQVLALLALITCADCGGWTGQYYRLEPVRVTAVAATTMEIANPLRGQYENLSIPLFPQGNPAQAGYPAWPAPYDASIRMSWRDLQPTDPRTLPSNTSDDTKYDFTAVDDALARLHSRGMRLTLRVYAYNSCCDAIYPGDTNIAIPDWLRSIPGTSTSLPGQKSASSDRAVAQVVPDWNSSDYLSGFEELLAALGRRYDRDERLSVFEFSGYGDFSENHIAYLRDVVNTPGPAPEDSVGALGYFSQYRDQNITAASIQRLVTANTRAFPHTQLVVTPQNPEIVRQLFAESIAATLSSPVGIRSDCLGVQDPLPAWAFDAGSGYIKANDSVVQQLKERLAVAPVITEWCKLPADGDRRAYYDKGLRDVVMFHVSMTSSSNFPDRDGSVAMEPELFALWSRANVFGGYRYSVSSLDAPRSRKGKRAAIDVAWTNYGSAVATEDWRPGYRLVDRFGATARMLPAGVNLKTLVSTPSRDEPGDQPVPASFTERLRINLVGLNPGTYTIMASVAWQQHKPQASHSVDYPPMHLARDGRDPSGWYPIATLDVPQDS